MPPSAEPVSTAPKQREITATHEAGHAVAGVVLFGSIDGARINPDGSGYVWRGKPSSDNTSEYEQAARGKFSATEDMLRDVGPMPIKLVNQNLALWRSSAIFSLAGPEAERLEFGLTLSPPNSDQLAAKMYCRRCSVGRAGANALYEHCRLEARTILEKNWRAVEAVARALSLSIDDQLDGEEVAQLIKRNAPL